MTKYKKSNQEILITVDVEDWFQVENFKTWIPFSSWSSKELRVEKNVHRLLDLFDSINLDDNLKARPNSLACSKNNEPKRKIRATFFMLGWIAERLPNLVMEIEKRGHEIASHGYKHDLCNQTPSEEIKKDLIRCKKLLEDIIGVRVNGFRAPSFSISDNILTLIQDAGYLYDSSYNSFSLNSRYGQIFIHPKSQTGIALEISDNFHELPISNLYLKKINWILPLGGGGYFRLLPFSLFKYGVKSVINNSNTYMFYIHPWEIDPGQPIVSQASIIYKFRHYLNLNQTYSKLTRLILSFSHCNFITCSEYLQR